MKKKAKRKKEKQAEERRRRLDERLRALQAAEGFDTTETTLKAFLRLEADAIKRRLTGDPHDCFEDLDDVLGTNPSIEELQAVAVRVLELEECLDRADRLRRAFPSPGKTLVH